MTRFIILIVLCSLTSLKAQVIVTGSGQSSVLIENMNIGLNLGESEVMFSINNAPQNLKPKSVGLIWGGSVNAKNKNGIGNLFTNGYRIPSAQGNILVGLCLSNIKDLKDNLAQEAAVRRDSRSNELEKDVDKKIDLLQLNLITNSNILSNAEITALNAIIDGAQAALINNVCVRLRPSSLQKVR